MRSPVPNGGMYAAAFLLGVLFAALCWFVLKLSGPG